MSTYVKEFMEELDVGEFEKKVGAALTAVAIGVMRNDSGTAKGRVTIDFELGMLSAEKINVKSKLKYVKPTSGGVQTEEDTTETPMYIGRTGKLSVLPPKNGLFDSDNDRIVINVNK